ncbi:hypothetical protein Tco_1030258 [Tanacetum coccineum]|uniref:Uncharacterized protein n=1 Tax=Tanacetum coccineum TaxID=301880 RepID=A0ABQ5G7Z3_9ASTR
MDSQTTQTIKLPILQPSEYDLWKIRMEQYLQCIDYTLWKIIENGNVPIVIKTVNGKDTVILPTSVKEKAQKVTGRGIENRFGGNTATKKTQKNLMKKQYENFVASNTEVIEQTYERIQKLISQLEMHGEVIPQEDINHKILEGARHGNKTELGLTSPRWSVSTATREDTLQGSTGHLGIKTAGTGKLLQMP